MEDTVLTKEQADSLLEEINSYALRERTVKKLRKSKVVFPTPPIIPEEWRNEEGDFVMPQDLTVLDSQDLGRLMTFLNNLLSWYGAVLSATKIDRLSAERIMNFTEAKIRMAIMTNKEMLKEYKAREDKEAFVNTHDVVRQVQDFHDRQKAAEIMTQQLYDDLERSQRTVSREITRRSGEWDMHNREHNLT